MSGWCYSGWTFCLSNCKAKKEEKNFWESCGNSNSDTSQNKNHATWWALLNFLYSERDRVVYHCRADSRDVLGFNGWVLLLMSLRQRQKSPLAPWWANQKFRKAFSRGGRNESVSAGHFYEASRKWSSNPCSTCESEPSWGCRPRQQTDVLESFFSADTPYVSGRMCASCLHSRGCALF